MSINANKEKNIIILQIFFNNSILASLFLYMCIILKISFNHIIGLGHVLQY